VAKFILSINDECFKLLDSVAKNRGINVQMLIRAVIIPEWTQVNPDAKNSTISNPMGSRTNGDDAKVDAPVLPQIAVGKTAWREVDTYRSLYFRNIRR
jgi:hypothetical protein